MKGEGQVAHLGYPWISLIGLMQSDARGERALSQSLGLHVGQHSFQ